MIEAKVNNDELTQRNIDNYHELTKNDITKINKVRKQLPIENTLKKQNNKLLIQKSGKQLKTEKTTNEENKAKIKKNVNLKNTINFMEETEGEENQKNTCSTCKHFYQHHILFHEF